MEPPFCALGYHAGGLRQAVACGLRQARRSIGQGRVGKGGSCKNCCVKSACARKAKGNGLVFEFPAAAFFVRTQFRKCMLYREI